MSQGRRHGRTRPRGESSDDTAEFGTTDPRLEAARAAERRVYEHYGLTFTDHHVPVPELDTEVRVAEVGSGPPVVLIPGGIGHGDLWTPLLAELDGFTAYVMDRPGGGLSGPIDHRTRPLSDIAALSTGAVFDHLDLDAAPAIGSSMGGLWAMRFALARPARVSALALLGCPALYPGTSAPLPMRLVSVPLLGEVVYDAVMRPDGVGDTRETLEFLGHPATTARDLPEPLLASWYRMENLPDAKRSWVSLLQQAVRVRGANPESAFTHADLRRLRAPVSLLWGSDDPFGSVETGRRGADVIPDATFERVGVGHQPWFDDPARCGASLREFLQEHA